MRLSGGAGFRYENSVAARFLLDMLAGLNSFDPDFGRITQVDWQARDAGWLLDDLALTCECSPDEQRYVGISIKSDQQLSTGGFPSDFVDLAWGQWLEHGTARLFQRGRDGIILVTAELPRAVKSDWTALLSEILHGTADRIVSRLSSNTEDGSQSSSLQRAIVASFACPPRYEHPVETEETVRLLHDVRVLDFDFVSPTSQSQGHALRDCQSILTSGDAGEARDLWDRVIGIADEKRPAGGSLDLCELLAALRDRFSFRDHPDYRADWEALLRRGREAMADVETHIAKLAQLPRSDDRTSIRRKLTSAGMCLLVGESGSGKSALAKEIALADYPRTIWLSANILDHESAVDFERAISLRHPLVDILRSAPTRCLVVFDGVETYSERALRMTARITTELLSSKAAHIHLLLSLQFQSADAKLRQLAALGIPQESLQITPVGRPEPQEIQELLSPFPDLQWLALRPQLRPLLTNLKVLDWFAHTLPKSHAADDQQYVGLTAVIDQLWQLWTESAADGLARSHLLMKLATSEAETLSRGVPRTQLGQNEQQTLPGLEQSGLIRIRDERVSLAHDLLGDWARLRVLVAEDATLTATESRAASPRWQQAVRLFGQRLLEASDDRQSRWRRSVGSVKDESPSAGLMRDLFLDALFQATNATELLNRTWDTLIAADGALLNRLLDRFLFVASLPDPLVAALSADQEEATRLQHLLRIPFWPYWGPVLTVLHARRGDVVRLAPYTAARVCALWLRTTPDELGPYRPVPWRTHAGELALEIAREIQARNAEGNYYGSDRAVYEAALYAAPLFPAEASALCLELAARKDISPEIAGRVAEAGRKRREERARQNLEAGERSKAPRPIGIPRGRRRPPWPDGPGGEVDRKFREACLAGAPVTAMIKADPDVALEVLLAVSIEEPQHDDFVRSSLPECGLSYWPEGDPPAYFRGPFLQFFRLAPNQALSFVIRLTNFGSHRYAEDRVWLDVMVDGQTRRWYGDSNVFRWHHDWPLSHGSQIQSGLMALEQWLYEQLDQRIPIEPWITRILAESESVAFAGVLLDVGKRAPELFSTVLTPLFFTWVIWDWDFQLATLRQSEREPPGFWFQQAPRLFTLAQKWHQLPHRSEALLTANGVIARTMLGHQQFSAFFEEVRSVWKAELRQEGKQEPEHLRLLVERLDPANYTFEQRGHEIVPVDFKWPEIIARQNEEDLRELSERQTISLLPWRCRQFLDAGTPLPPDQLQWLWDFLQAIDAKPTELPSDSSGPLFRMEDVFCGGIAVLLSTNRDWLLEDVNRMTWCRRKLQATIDDPPPLRRIDSELSVGNVRWDCFAAECGVLLLAVDPSDNLAKKLVAAGLVAFNYNTTALTMARAAAARRRLGDAFPRMIALAVQWAALRPLQIRQDDPSLKAERESFLVRKRGLVEAFVNGSLSPIAADLGKINAETREARDAISEKQFPGSKARSQRRKLAGRHKSREVFYPDHLSLDPHVMKTAFAWLDVRAAHAPAERIAWLGLIQEMVGVVLQAVPVVDPASKQEIDGLPSDFDGWVFELAARTIPCLTAVERPEEFWQAILDRGAPAHQWVERFFWHWFTVGFAASPSAAEFVRIWRAMISHALGHAAWDPSGTVWYELDGLVVELLCFDTRWNAIVRTEDNAQIVGTLEDIFERALERWGTIPKIISGLVMFATQPGAKQLLVPALRWTSAAVRSFDTYDWKYGLEENVIEFLHTCWQREGERIARDDSLRTAFLAVLTILVSRGSHAAIALNSRVVGSIGV